MILTKNRDYKIGYGRPPEATRFRKGQSGNRSGRPGGTKNLKTDLAEELREKITLREGERTKRISKQRAFIKTLLAKALKGDARAANTLIVLLSRTFDLAASDAVVTEPLSEQENELLEGIVARLVQRERKDSPDESDQGEGEES